GGSGREGVPGGAPVGLDAAAVGQQLAGVLERDHTVAEQAPALLRKARDRSGGLTVDGFGGGTLRVVLAHQDLRTLGVLCHGSHDQ
ncbi:MAG TPA: hypothetical protein VE547_08285, partial [Mycobacteriales bacterium]|nr:hypothetical protein [Mycobacteriales bacterium]